MTELLWQRGRMWCGNPTVTGLPLRLLPEIWVLGPPVELFAGRRGYTTNHVVIDEDDGSSYLFIAFADRIELDPIFSADPPMLDNDTVLRDLWGNDLFR